MTSPTKVELHKYFEKDASQPLSSKRKSGIADFQYQKWLYRTTPHLQSSLVKKFSKRRKLNNELKSENLLIFSPDEHQENHPSTAQKAVFKEITVEGIINLSQESRISSLNLFPAIKNNISLEAYQKFIYDITQHPSMGHVKKLKITAGIQVLNPEQNLKLEMIYSLPDLIQLLVKTHHVKHLSIQGLASKEGKELFKTISHLPLLKRLELSEISCEDFDRLIYLKKLENLELFKIRDCPFVALEHLQFLKKMASVKKIVINNMVL